MALVRCPECQKDVSTRATACPHCGCPLNESASPPPEEPNRPQRSANSLDGTKWAPVGKEGAQSSGILTREALSGSTIRIQTQE